MRARRALLYVPGSEQNKIDKALGLGADAVCLDLEDGVSPSMKVEARQLVADALAHLDFGRSERLARMNGLGSGLELLDLEALVPARPDAIVIPKVAEAEQMRHVSEVVRVLEIEHAIPSGSIGLIALIESARGVIHLPQIAGADPRLRALIFGAEDFAADVGATRTTEGVEISYARSAVVTACAAFELDAIDQVFLDFRDPEGLRADSVRGMQLGFTGKQVIHPAQVPIVQEVFTPTDEAIARALRITEAAAEQLAQGRGAFALDNKMVDLPIIKAAEKVLERARAAGKLPE